MCRFRRFSNHHCFKYRSVCTSISRLRFGQCRFTGTVCAIIVLMAALIRFTSKGLYCPQGDFYLDPWQPVHKAVITHGHSDHARPGSGSYLGHPLTIAIMRHRLGDNNYQSLEWNTPIYINGVQLSLHPSGHIIGGSQIRLEYKGEVWAVGGDYKLADDGISGKFEPIRCHSFITESTFGLPVYKWKSQEIIYHDLIEWIGRNKSNGKSSVLIAYSLGKAQRVIEALRQLNETIWAHGAVYNMQQTLIDADAPLLPVKRVLPETPKAELKNAIIIAPSGAEGSTWIRRFTPFETGICSGWMQVRGNVRRSKGDRGFVLSDHADWNGLLMAVKETGAEKVYVTHGFQAAFSRYLNEMGIESAEVQTQFGDEDEAVTNDNI